ncbi:MAG TPA: septum formation initiator family protein [Myxococcales bacterium]|nr:septum formation initiator family protein [Myxococcales bacterium]
MLHKLSSMSPRRRLMLGALAASACIGAASLLEPGGLRRLQRLQADIDRQEQKNRELRDENARLSRTVRELSPPVSPAALEKAAREQLGFVRPDEILFQFE